MVLLPYKITLLSNRVAVNLAYVKFYYPIKLHYSQTDYKEYVSEILFYYPIKLHYSQTVPAEFPYTYLFYYPITLHYSQTRLQK